MEFKTAINTLSDRIGKLKGNVTTEEATKTSFILPMISALGYDIFDPTIVVPEFTADIGKKKGEKVDYAIIKDGNPIILIEAKPHTESLDRHKTQLERYFTVTDSKFGVLTNGIEYRFYSDLERPNVMDESPFLVLDMLNLKDRDIKQLEKFSNDTINIDHILSMADTKKYVNGIKDIFKNEALNPSDDMARFFASSLTNRTLRQHVLDDFKVYVKQAFSEVISDMVTNRINTIKNRLTEEDSPSTIVDDIEEDSGIITTEDELQGFFIVKSILAEVVPTSRVIARDTKSYFGILLDDNNRKWICRLRFNSSNKYIGIHTNEKEEEKFTIDEVEDIYKYKNELLSALKNVSAQ